MKEKNTTNIPNGKAWRSDPRITSREAKFFDFRPFATVAAITVGHTIHVGVARCNPIDKFNMDVGRARALHRARLQYALHLGLIPEGRANRLRRRENNGGTFMMSLSKREFAEHFAAATPMPKPTKANASPKKSAVKSKPNTKAKTKSKAKVSSATTRSKAKSKPKSKSKKS